MSILRLLAAIHFMFAATPGIADTRSSATLSDTTKFIRENLMDNYFQVVELSCSAMLIRAEFNDKRKGGELKSYSFTLPVREVTFSETMPFDQEYDGVEIKCNSGKCITYKNHLTPFNTRMEDSMSIGSLIEDTRVLKALHHLQKLCGGVLGTAF